MVYFISSLEIPYYIHLDLKARIVRVRGQSRSKYGKEMTVTVRVKLQFNTLRDYLKQSVSVFGSVLACFQRLE